MCPIVHWLLLPPFFLKERLNEMGKLQVGALWSQHMLTSSRHSPLTNGREDTNIKN